MMDKKTELPFRQYMLEKTAKHRGLWLENYMTTCVNHLWWKMVSASILMDRWLERKLVSHRSWCVIGEEIDAIASVVSHWKMIAVALFNSAWNKQCSVYSDSLVCSTDVVAIPVCNSVYQVLSTTWCACHFHWLKYDFATMQINNSNEIYFPAVTFPYHKMAALITPHMRRLKTLNCNTVGHNLFLFRAA